MNISVESSLDPDNTLQFVIKVTGLQECILTDEDISYLEPLDESMRIAREVLKNSPDSVADGLIRQLHNAKEQIYNKAKNSLTHTLSVKLEEKFYPILQEIYNSIIDSQTKKVRNWMLEFDPQRTRYYFDFEDVNKQEDED